MSKIKNERTTHVSLVKKNRLSEEQLVAMDRELQDKYIKTVYSKYFNEDLHPFDHDQWMIDHGAMSKKNTIGDLLKYEQLSEDLRQFLAWKRRKEFVDRKKLESLEQLSRQLGQDLQA